MQSNSLILVLGGAKSGKSKFAEELYSRQEDICYIATGLMKQPDAEMELRISKHRQRRSSCWTTREQYQDFSHLIQQEPRAGYILDDVTMAITNLFYDLVSKRVEYNQIDSYLSKLTVKELEQLKYPILTQWRQLIATQKVSKQSIVLVSNEVGLGIVPATKQTRVLRDIYGEVNQVLAQEADEVYFVVSGIPLKIK